MGHVCSSLCIAGSHDSQDRFCIFLPSTVHLSTQNLTRTVCMGIQVWCNHCYLFCTHHFSQQNPACITYTIHLDWKSHNWDQPSFCINLPQGWTHPDTFGIFRWNNQCILGGNNTHFWSSKEDCIIHIWVQRIFYTSNPYICLTGAQNPYHKEYNCPSHHKCSSQECASHILFFRLDHEVQILFCILNSLVS